MYRFEDGGKMEFRVAEIKDIQGVLDLHYRYQVDSILAEDRSDGFVTTAFTREQLANLIDHERGLFIGVKEGEVVAYVMAASWEFWSIWPMFAHMITDLPNLQFLGQVLSTDNSYQYGPVCIDKQLRGTGVLEGIFDFAREEMSKRYPILVTFINKINPRSYHAHTRKLGLELIQEFEFNNNQYYELVYDTQKPVGC